jgi:hypothetical protein
LVTVQVRSVGWTATWIRYGLLAGYSTGKANEVAPFDTLTDVAPLVTTRPSWSRPAIVPLILTVPSLLPPPQAARPAAQASAMQARTNTGVDFIRFSKIAAAGTAKKRGLPADSTRL